MGFTSANLTENFIDAVYQKATLPFTLSNNFGSES
jgi:hypothetical protein